MSDGWGAHPGPDPERSGPDEHPETVESLGGGDVADLSGLADLEPDGAEVRHPPDMVGVAAVAVGFIGLVVFGILAALIAGVLGAWAGQRARDAGRSMELGYLAVGLAALDGIVWLTLQFLFELPAQIG